MSRLMKTVPPICIGTAMLLPFWLGTLSLSNVLNLFQGAVGLGLIIFGVKCLFVASPPADTSLDRDSQAPQTKLEIEPERSPFERLYILYINFLILLPGLVAALCWAVAFQLMGCEMSGASTEVHGCGAFGKGVTYLFVFSSMLLFAMVTVLVPVTIVYLLCRLRTK